MTATHNTGPNIVTGYVPGTGGSNPDAGPSATYQADSIVDVRWPVNPGLSGAGHVKGYLNHPYPTLVDGVPQTISTSMVCPALAASTAISASAQTFPLQTTVAAGRAVSVPVVPFGSSVKASNVVNCLTLDPGHTIGTISSGTKAVTAVGDSRLIKPGSYIAIVGAGASANALLIARVLASSKTAATLTLDTAAGTTATNAKIIVLDSTGVTAFPYINLGAVAVFDPASSLARAVSVTAGASDGNYVVVVSGYDVFNVPMSEQITSSASSTVNGKKAFKHISGVTVARGSGNATITNSLSVGTTDIFGMNLRSEKFEYTSVWYNGGFISANTGWVAGLAFTTASTTTTADVRGTYLVQSASDGVKRLAIYMSVPIAQLVDATYDDAASLNGPVQV